MGAPRRPGRVRIDPTDGSESWRPSPGYLAIAIALVTAGLAWAWLLAPTPMVAVAAPTFVGSATSAVRAHPPAEAASPVPVAPPLVVAAAASGAAPAPSPEISRTRDPHGDQTPDISDYVNSGERPTMAEVIARLHQAGVHGGLGAFPPPGTRPPLVGLAVPEDFPLPAGYVRHHQATDDGQRIEPILMYAPDVPLVDAAGRPLTSPADRVVPPERAPPGLPLRRIVIPAPAEAGSPGR